MLKINGLDYIKEMIIDESEILCLMECIEDDGNCEKAKYKIVFKNNSLPSVTISKKEYDSLYKELYL